MADTFNIEFKASKHDANWILSGCRGEPIRMVLARTPELDAHLGTGGQVRVVYTTVDKSVELQTRAGVHRGVRQDLPATFLLTNKAGTSIEVAFADKVI